MWYDVCTCNMMWSESFESSLFPLWNVASKGLCMHAFSLKVSVDPKDIASTQATCSWFWHPNSCMCFLMRGMYMRVLVHFFFLRISMSFNVPWRANAFVAFLVCVGLTIRQASVQMGLNQPTILWLHKSEPSCMNFSPERNAIIPETSLRLFWTKAKNFCDLGCPSCVCERERMFFRACWEATTLMRCTCMCEFGFILCGRVFSLCVCRGSITLWWFSCMDGTWKCSQSCFLCVCVDRPRSHGACLCTASACIHLFAPSKVCVNSRF